MNNKLLRSSVLGFYNRIRLYRIISAPVILDLSSTLSDVLATSPFVTQRYYVAASVALQSY